MAVQDFFTRPSGLFFFCPMGGGGRGDFGGVSGLFIGVIGGAGHQTSLAVLDLL